MRNIRTAGCVLLLFIVAAATVLGVHGECTACKGGSPSAQQEVLNNEWAVFLGKETANEKVVSSSNGLVSPQISRQSNPSLSTKSSNDPSSNTEDAKVEDDSSNSKKDPPRSQSFASVLVPIEDVDGQGIILDISPHPHEYIKGAISINYENFVTSDKHRKSVSELAAIFGAAGISENDPVLIYGECQQCGGGPSAGTFVYWIMKYLGHKKVKLLDAGIDDWVAAKKPTVNKSLVLPAKNYTPTLNSNLLATYEYVKSGIPQIVDAREPEYFAAGSIPKAINISYDSVLTGKKIKDEAALKRLFAGLNKYRTVVVYSDSAVKASMVWFVLSLMGYDARLYSWQDWLENRPKLNIDLLKASAQPNPANRGAVVHITVTFVEENQSIDHEKETANNETLLTIKGCVGCGFGSPQGFADISNSGGVARIGSTSQAQKGTADNSFKVTAVVKNQAGDVVSKGIIMKRVSEDEFTGVWNANVAAGIYKVDIVASLEDISKTFPDALQIEVTGTSKYKNPGN